MARPRKRKYVSRLTKEDQMVRLILQIMNRDEKRRKRELSKRRYLVDRHSNPYPVGMPDKLPRG